MSLGPLIAALVTVAGVRDPVALADLIDQVAAAHPSSGSSGRAKATVSTSSNTQPDTVATSYPRLDRRDSALCRLVRDYETLPAGSETIMRLTATDPMASRLVGENIISLTCLDVTGLNTCVDMKHQEETPFQGYSRKSAYASARMRVIMKNDGLVAVEAVVRPLW